MLKAKEGIICLLLLVLAYCRLASEGQNKSNELPLVFLL